MRDFSSVSH